MIKKLIFPTILVLLLGLSACSLLPQDEPTKFVARPSEFDDHVTFETVENVANDTTNAIITIYSKNGIGGTEIEQISGEKPAQYNFHLYLSGLEELKFAYGQTLITVNVSSTAGNEVRQSMRDSGAGVETAVLPTSPYWMDVTIVPTEGTVAEIPLLHGYIAVQAPADFLNNQDDSFALQWVDFYR